MKKKIFGCLLPMSAFIALTGTGFGLWVFNETHAAVAGTELKLINAIAAENLTVSSNVVLTLDQVAKPAYNGAAADGEPDIASGAVTIKTDLTQWAGDDSNKQATAENYGVTTADKVDTSFTLTYTVETTINGDLAQWIEYDSAAVAVCDDSVNTAKGAVSEKTAGTKYEADYKVAAPTDSAVAAFTWTPEFKWIKTPATLQAWKDLKANIESNSSIVFNISVTKTA